MSSIQGTRTDAAVVPVPQALLRWRSRLRMTRSAGSTHGRQIDSPVWSSGPPHQTQGAPSVSARLFHTAPGRCSTNPSIASSCGPSYCLSGLFSAYTNGKHRRLSKTSKRRACRSSVCLKDEHAEHKQPNESNNAGNSSIVPARRRCELLIPFVRNGARPPVLTGAPTKAATRRLRAPY